MSLCNDKIFFSIQNLWIEGGDLEKNLAAEMEVKDLLMHFLTLLQIKQKFNLLFYSVQIKQGLDMYNKI